MRAAIQLIILMVAVLPVLAQPNLDIELTPVNPPIIIPAQGCSFQFSASVVNYGPSQVLIWMWTRAWLHGQTFPGQAITPPSLTPPVGVTVSRIKTQNVPATWYSGEYTYRLYAGLVPYGQIQDSSEFSFTKLAAMDRQSVWDAECTGEPFTDEVKSPADDPILDVTLTPVNPPIIIPPQGGSFQFNSSVVNNSPTQQPFVVWAKIVNQPGIWIPPALGPVIINPPLNVLVSRLRIQTIPGSWPPDVYIYRGYANFTYSHPVIDSSSFTFTKTWSGDGGSWVSEAACTGELFPGEQLLITHNSSLITSANPNPFNPTTAISYKLQTASHVSIRVFDTAGRLVTTLADGWREAGTHQVTFDGSRLASGMYLYTLQAEGQIVTGKMMLVK
jgi:hypothetical protein